MLLWDQEKRLRELVEFDLERAIAKVPVQERAIASLKAGQSIIPLWLDQIHQRLASKLAR